MGVAEQGDEELMMGGRELRRQQQITSTRRKPRGSGEVLRSHEAINNNKKQREEVSISRERLSDRDVEEVEGQGAADAATTAVAVVS